MNRIIELQQATCPECCVPLTGSEHMPTCAWPTVMASMMAQSTRPLSPSDPLMLANANAPKRQTMDYSKCKPSLGDCCPRHGCNLMMARTQVEGRTRYVCPTLNDDGRSHYEAEEVNAR